MDVQVVDSCRTHWFNLASADYCASKRCNGVCTDLSKRRAYMTYGAMLENGIYAQCNSGHDDMISEASVLDEMDKYSAEMNNFVVEVKCTTSTQILRCPRANIYPQYFQPKAIISLTSHNATVSYYNPSTFTNKSFYILKKIQS